MADPGPGARRSKAADLREQLAWWRGAPEPTWPAREQRLDWLEHALSEAYDISRGLAQHGALDAEAGLSAYLAIVAARPGRPRAAPSTNKRDPNSVQRAAAGRGGRPRRLPRHRRGAPRHPRAASRPGT